jgi:nucleotide-binding universal stress UspA family protein
MFQNVLVPLDGSSLAEQALSVASMVAARSRRSETLMEVMFVDTDASRADGGGSAEDRIYIQAIAEEATRLLGVAVTGIVVPGDPASAIVEHARQRSSDLIVMTTHGRTGLRRAVMGSVADRVVRDAGRPVLLVRPEAGVHWRLAQANGFRRILVPLDGSEQAGTVVAPVLDLCRWMQPRLILTRVVFPVMEMVFSDAGIPIYGVVDEDATRHVVNQAQDSLSQLALQIESERGITVDTSVKAGNDISHSLLEAVRESRADLVAMATHSRGASRLLIASITDRLLRETPLPLLLLHPQATTPANAEAATDLAHA